MVLAAKTKPRISRTHKKRVGQHRPHTKHYLKAYHPYIPIVLVIGLGLLLNIFWSHAGKGVLGSETALNAQHLLDDTNSRRTADDEMTLELNSKLSLAAQAKADDMVANNYWSHNTPDGRTPWVFMTDAGYTFQAAGENLAYGFDSSSDTLAGWMSSPGHRANILNANYSQVGFGIAHAANYIGAGPETVIVAMYGEPKNAAVSGVNFPNQLKGVLSDATTASISTGSQSVSRIAVLSNNSAGIMYALAALAACGLLWMITRHALAWRRVVVHSEEFIVRHRMLDVVIVSVTTLCVLLTHTAGFIH